MGNVLRWQTHFPVSRSSETSESVRDCRRGAAPSRSATDCRRRRRYDWWQDRPPDLATPPPSVCRVAGLGELIFLGLDIAFHVAAGGVLLRPDTDRIFRNVSNVHSIAVLDVVRLHESADAVFAPLVPMVLPLTTVGAWSAVAGSDRDIGLLHLVAGLGVERDQLRVEGGVR